jgi:hypothetical protein
MQGSVSQKGGAGVLVGVGAAIAIITLLVLQSATSVPISLRTETITSTATSTIDSTQSVSAAYAAYLRNLKSENTTGLAAEYESQASLVWGYAPSTGADEGGRRIVGVANITQLFYSNFCPSLCLFDTVNLANETHVVSIAGNGTEATLDSNITIYGNSTGGTNPPGFYTRSYADTAALNFSYVLAADGNWLISNETWIYTTYNFCALGSAPCGP